MNFLLYQLQRLLMLPVRLITSPMEAFSTLSDGSGRSDAMIKGLPAAIVAVLGTSAVFFMGSDQEGLVESYTSKLQKTDNQRKILKAELRQDLLNKKALGGVVSESESAANDDEAKEEKIEKLNEQSNIYLEKLIAIDPDQNEFRYRLALRALEEGNVQKCIKMMKQISPLDTPGYPPAHLQLALLFENSPAKNPIQRISNLDNALIHVEHCLTNDINNLDALKIKARLLSLKGSREDARIAFKKVFDVEPKYFRPLIQLQNSAGERNATLATASSAFSQQLSSSEVQKDSARWVAAWQGYAQTMTLLNEFPELETRLLKELDRYKDSSDNLARMPFLKQYLAQLYIAWTASINGNPLSQVLTNIPEKNQLDMLDYYAKAYSYKESDSSLLQIISRLAFSPYKNVRTKARTLYNPEVQDNVPPEVLNQMGLQALNVKDYKSAQRFYEKARALAPDNSAILNNLAYAYLKGEDDGDLSQRERDRMQKSNAERAHDLVAQAIRVLPENQRNSPNMSMYKHTLGTALMQLKSYAAAAAEFEQALRIRPNNVDLLESVIVCYDNFNLDSTPFRNKLDRIQAEEKSQP